MPARKRSRKTDTPIPEELTLMRDEATKIHGEGVISLGVAKPMPNHIPTGNFILDLALLGGFAQGYISMVYGYHSTHKSTNLLRTVAECQRKHPEKYVAWIDAEGMFDETWAEKHGVDTRRLVFAAPEYGELAVDLFEDLMTKEAISMVVVDSIPHLVPHKMIENSAEDDTMAALSRLMSKMASKITMANNRERRKGHWVTILLVNQPRTKVGFVMGNPQTLPGGIQINHIPTTKIEFKKKGTKMSKDRYGNEVADYDECGFKLEKVKHGQSLRSGEYQVFLNPDNEEGLPEGAIDNFSTVVAYAKKMGFISGGGSKWTLHTLSASLQGETFRKLDDIKGFLRDTPEEYETLAKSIIAEQRKIKGLSALPPDGYLVSRRARLVSLPSSSVLDESAE